MKSGKHEKKKFKIIEAYSVLIFIVALFMSIGYAEISGTIINITGTVEAKVQEGVFITNITKNSGDTTDSEINYYIGTMFESKTVLADIETASETYEITLYNNSETEYVFLGTLTDIEDGKLYDNENIEFTVTGIEQYKTTISPTQTLKFTITFKYKDGTNRKNNILNSKLNFRFKEIPKLALNNENQTHTLNDIYPDYMPQEYEFNVSNYYNETEINTVPMTYEFLITIDSPLTAKIYNEDGTEVISPITVEGDGKTKITNTYTLKIIWDSSNQTENIEYNNLNYINKEFKGNIILKASPNDEKYLEYTIEKQFNIEATSSEIYFDTSINNNEIEFDGNKAELDLLIKNNNGFDYNIYDVQYEISLENNEKFAFSTDNLDLTDGKIIKTLKGSSLLSENLKLYLTVTQNANINLVENASIKVKITKPYVKEITIPISIKLVPGNIETSIDTTTGTFQDSSSITTHKIIVKNNNSIPITYRIIGNNTSELNITGANQDIKVAAKSQVETAVTIAPVQNYIYQTDSSKISIKVNVVEPYEFNVTDYTISIKTYASKMSDILINKYAITTTTPSFKQNVTTTEGSGLFQTTDTNGNIYYFRGVVSNNYVLFADKLWRIMRVNSDGTVRMILNTPLNDQRDWYNQNNAVSLYNGSDAESIIETWYNSNLVNYKSYIYQNAVFIHDVSYGGWARAYNGKPVIDKSQFGSTSLYSITGNKYLTVPVGLPTVDEIMMAGGVTMTDATSTGVGSTGLQPNYEFYIANDLPDIYGMWLMSPFSSTAVICFKKQAGVYRETPKSERALKPVIELNANNCFKGTGTEADPYVIY